MRYCLSGVGGAGASGFGVVGFSMSVEGELDEFLGCSGEDGGEWGLVFVPGFPNRPIGDFLVRRALWRLVLWSLGLVGTRRWLWRGGQDWVEGRG